MNTKNLYKALFLLLFLSYSCASKKVSDVKIDKKINETVLNDTINSNNKAFLDLIQSKRIFHPSRTIDCDIIHTKLELEPDWNTSTMKGKASLTMKARLYPIDTVHLDAKGMIINSVKIKQQALTFSYDSLKLHITLDKKYSRFESFTLDIEYLSQPEKRITKSGQAISSDKGLFFINPKGENKNKMPQIWTQGETESNSVWFPTLDTPNAKTTQEIYLTVDDKYTTLSNGKLISSIKNPDGTRTDYWFQKLPHAPYLFMFAIGEFKIVKDFYKKNDGSNLEVNYYVEPEWENDAKFIFGETPKMIEYFSKLLGVEYPWDKFHQIVVSDYVSGAMENTGAVVFGDFVYKNKRELIDDNDEATIAHELFHHWFGDLVTCESWSNLPLNESFANYSQYLWDEYKYGKDEADYQAEIEKGGYFGQISYSEPHPLIWHNYDDKEQMFDGHSYNKGGRILHLLRNTIGDTAFFLGLNNYLKNNKYKAAEYTNLRLAFEEITGQDLNWFFDQWFLKAGHPKLEVSQQVIENEVILKVYQRQDLTSNPLYFLPIKILLEDDKGKRIYPININNVENSFIFKVNGKLKNLCFDYDKALLGEIIEDKAINQYIYEFYSSDRYLARSYALLEACKNEIPEAKKLIFDALNDSFWEIRKTAINNSRLLDDTYFTKLNEKLTELAKKDPNSKVRNEALIYLFKQIPDNEMLNLLKDKIENDSSYLVVGTCLELLSELNPNLALEKASTLENEKSNKIKVKIAQLYAAKGKEKQLEYFENIFEKNNFAYYDGIICLNSLSIFLSTQLPNTQIKAIPIYSKISKDGNMLMKTFLSKNISFVIGKQEEKIKELKAKNESLIKSNFQQELAKNNELIKEYEYALVQWNEFFQKYEDSKK